MWNNTTRKQNKTQDKFGDLRETQIFITVYANFEERKKHHRKCTVDEIFCFSKPNEANDQKFCSWGLLHVNRCDFYCDETSLIQLITGIFSWWAKINPPLLTFAVFYANRFKLCTISNFVLIYLTISSTFFSIH
jgi:hypothetical protein